MAGSVISTTAATGIKSGTSITTPSISVQSGDIIVALFPVVTTPTVTDTDGNTYSNPSGSDVWWVATAAHTTSLTVNVTVPTAQKCALIVVVTRGTGTPSSSPIEGSGTSTTPTITSASAASGDVCVAGVNITNGPTGDTFTADADTSNGTWSAVTTSGTTGNPSSSNHTMRLQTKLITGSGTQTYNPTLGTSRDWWDDIIIVPQASGAPPAKIGFGVPL